jgi:phage-related tail protein
MRNAQIDELLRQLDEEESKNVVIMEGLRKEFYGYEEARLQHVADVERITKENKKNIANYADEIKSRNSGFELPQQEGESDADYAQRMIDTAHTVVDPNQALIQAQLYLYKTMKDRLSEMMQPYKVEGVLNQIVKVDGYEGLQVMKDRWPSLKKGLTDTFGDLRRVDNTDSIAIFLLENSPVNAKAPMASPAH